jgi:hypothetical protein
MTARNTLLRILAALLVASLAGMACDESSSNGAGTNVALLVNTDYVDYEVEEPPPEVPAMLAADEAGYEATNLEAALESFDANVTTFEDTDAASIGALLADNEALVLPEPENGAYSEAFDGEAMDEISDFVQIGGRLVIFMASRDKTLGFLNDTFGWSLEEGTAIPGDEPADSFFPAALTAYVHNVTDSEGTPFQTGAATLAPHSLTLAVSIGSLPIRALSMYDDQDDASAVAAVPYGNGWVLIMGWDWFDAAPLGARDGGWNSALHDAIRF